MILEGIVFVALKRAENKLRAPTEIPKKAFRTLHYIGRVMFLSSPDSIIRHIVRKKREEISKKTLSMIAAITPVQAPPTNRRFSAFVASMVEPEERIPELANNHHHNHAQNSNRHSITDDVVSHSSHDEADIEFDRSGIISDLEYRQLQWRFVAEIIDRFTFLLYLACLIVTPVVMFAIYPELNEPNYENE